MQTDSFDSNSNVNVSVSSYSTSSNQLDQGSSKVKLVDSALQSVYNHESHLLSPREQQCVLFYLSKLSITSKLLFTNLLFRVIQYNPTHVLVKQYQTKFGLSKDETQQALDQLSREEYFKLPNDSVDSPCRDAPEEPHCPNISVFDMNPVTESSQRVVTSVKSTIDDIATGLNETVTSLLGTENRLETFAYKFDYNSVSIETVLSHFTKSQLEDLLKSLEIKFQKKKSNLGSDSKFGNTEICREYMDLIVKKDSRQSTLFSFVNTSSDTCRSLQKLSPRNKLIYQKFLKWYPDSKIVLNPIVVAIFYRIFRIYFRDYQFITFDFSSDPKPLYPFPYYRYDLGSNFPKYFVSRSQFYFASLETFRNYEHALRLKYQAEIIDNLKSGKEKSAKSIQFYQTQIMPLILENLQLASLVTSEAPDSLSGKENGSIYKSPTWILVTPAIELLKSSKHYGAEWLLIDMVLSQRLYAISRRGKLYIRKAMLEEKYILEEKFPNKPNNGDNSMDTFIGFTLHVISTRPQIFSPLIDDSTEKKFESHVGKASKRQFQADELEIFAAIANEIQTMTEIEKLLSDTDPSLKKLQSDLVNACKELWLRMALATCLSGLRDSLVFESFQIDLRQRAINLKKVLTHFPKRSNTFGPVSNEFDRLDLLKRMSLDFDFSYITYQEAPLRFISATKTVESVESRIVQSTINNINVNKVQESVQRMPRPAISCDMIINQYGYNRQEYKQNDQTRTAQQHQRSFQPRSQWNNPDRTGSDPNDLALGSLTVEQVALLHYQKHHGYVGLHSENTMLTTLFALLFWDIIFAIPESIHSELKSGETHEQKKNDNPSVLTCSHFPVFEHECQPNPSDFFSSSFYNSRKAAIELRLSQIEGTVSNDYRCKAFDNEIQKDHENFRQVWEKDREKDTQNKNKEKRGNLKRNFDGTLKEVAKNADPDMRDESAHQICNETDSKIGTQIDSEICIGIETKTDCCFGSSAFDDYVKFLRPCCKQDPPLKFVTAQLFSIHSREFPRRTICTGVAWFDLVDVLAVACGLGSKRLSALMRLLATDYKNVSSGMPDLCLWKVSDIFSEKTRDGPQKGGRLGGKVVFVEVKSEHDKLGNKQIYWIDMLLKNDIQVELCKVLEPMEYQRRKNNEYRKNQETVVVFD